MTIAAIPSPSTAVWHLGPVPIRAYALCIVLGIAVACAVAEVRLRRRGAVRFAVLDVAVFAVPFGIVGARIYHLITSPQAYFGAGGDPMEALRIWHGGLGIWGAVAGGAVGAWIGCRMLGIPLTVFADALAPGLPLAQAVGRFGNWFNNELYGGPTTLPWGLEVHRMDPDNPGQSLLNPDGTAELLPDLHHPTFAYEALWNVGVAALVVLVERRFKLGRGRAFAVYVMGYTAGRFWIELMRTDPANTVLGARVNVWVSVLVFLGALAYFLLVRGPGQFLIPTYAGTGDTQADPPAEGKAAPAVVDGSEATAGATAGDRPVGDRSAGDGSAGDQPSGDRPAGGRTVTGYQVVTEDEFLAYQRGETADPVASAPGSAATMTGVADDDTDDGADLVDASMPALDDFADDETDDSDDDEIDGSDDEDSEDDIDEPVTGARPAGRPVGSADER